jgi:hypothetical protein
VLIFEAMLGAEGSVQGWGDVGGPVVDGHDWILPAAFSSALYSAATCCKAWSKLCGKSFPLFSARRRMPRQAVALKKNRRGTSPISKTSDNEHAAAALGNSKELSVQDSVSEPIPEFDHAPEDGTKIPSSVR